MELGTLSHPSAVCASGTWRRLTRKRLNDLDDDFLNLPPVLWSCVLQSLPTSRVPQLDTGRTHRTRQLLELLHFSFKRIQQLLSLHCHCAFDSMTRTRGNSTVFYVQFELLKLVPV